MAFGGVNTFQDGNSTMGTHDTYIKVSIRLKATHIFQNDKMLTR